MNAMDSGDESDDDPISTEILEDILDGSQSYRNINRREARYKICDRIKNHKVFNTVVKEIFARITTFDRIWFRSFSLYSRSQKLC